ncbi:SDR family NAD(P)-dependent oxidoreductase [Kluyvera intermedia]|uniref:SDR family NAD(P)-dependent oxidoreductase n=1 Tax=Kluyvera intermedia TaxID=61648 RepID=UPI002431E0E3|nr:SDR family NAD(P)-dependent oxidoreductase [Kluyvera intermedia]WEJ85000.1 MAG: SDR family NAD(P)-dependent oxidoreductase [Kluyvera intermedia]
MSSNNKVALITGANKGIGYETALKLGQQGVTVYIGARDEQRGNAAAGRLKASGIDARFIKIDLGDYATIDHAAEMLEHEHGRLDILVNNAGIMSTEDGSPVTTEMSVVKKTFDTNFFGALYVTQKVIPLLQKAASARVVNVSSGLGSLALNQDPSWEFADAKLIGYNASKAALNMLTVQLAWVLRESAIKVNSANPNFTNTELLPDTTGGRPVEDAARVIIHLALLPEDGPTGGFFEDDVSLPW